MSISVVEMQVPYAMSVTVSDVTLRVELSDGRSISVPTAWFPRLLHATSAERGDWKLIGAGEGVHWNRLDEDVSVEHLLAGRPSHESQESFRKWLASRGQVKPRDKRALRRRASNPS